jgi:PAS domain S-box-containing protein
MTDLTPGPTISPGGDSGSQRPLRVLLIEDNPGDARLMRELLSEAGASFELEWVADLGSGLERLADPQTVDAVLLDLSLPDSQGFATFERVNEAAPEVAIIMLTGLADEELAIEAVRAGAQDYLTKDEASGQLLSRAVRYAVERRRADEALRLSEQKLRLAMDASESGVWDLDVRSGRVTASAACQAMLGYEAVEMTDSLDEGWTAHLHPDDRGAALQALQDTLEDRTPFFEHDHRLRARNGDWIWVHGKGSVVERDAAGRPLRVLMTRTNITARRSAEQAAAENASLFAEQRRIATALQENFIRPLPVVPGLALGRVMRAAHKAELVGGDFSDVFLLDEQRVAVLIGDVAGKGIRAAGLTETVRTAVRAFATIDASPAFVLRKTNELLLRGGAPVGEAEFVTACLLVIDLRDGHVAHSSAGHPPVVHAGPFSCGLLDTVHGVPLGSLDWDYSDGHVTLALDDYLVLYTDGVTEARAQGRLFDEERLVETVCRLRRQPPSAVADGLLEAVTAYAGELKDDLLVLVLRFG